MRARALVLLAAVLALGGGLTDASTAEAPARASATAALATGSLGDVGVLRASGDSRRSRSAQASESGLSIGSGDLIARASRSGGKGRAEAKVAARSVNLFDGLVTAYGVRRHAIAAGGDTSYEGRVDGLKLDGRTIGAVDSREFFTVGDVATVAVNRGGTALKVTLKRAARGFPAGTTVSVGRVEAEATDGADPSATPTPTATPEPTPKDEGEDEDGDDDAGKKKQRKAGKDDEGDGKKGKRLTRRKAPEVGERLTAKRFAFPVYGEAKIGGPFGAPRQIGAHQGNDIFAPFGAPVLAVTDGELFNVGTLKISGNRLWLRSEAGDEFFYAHLSAFSPLAVNGRKVKAGDVLGFTGNTGDAEPTPPHVHFEIHPGGGAAIDPFPILSAWQDRRDVPPGAWLSRYGADTEQRPGALVEVRDFIAGE